MMKTHAIRRTGNRVPRLMATMLTVVLTLAGAGQPALSDTERPKLAVISTAFVLENKFRIIAESGATEGVDVHWLHVDTAPAGVGSGCIGGGRIWL